MINIKEIEDLQNNVDHLKTRSVKSDYWEHEKKVLKETMKKAHKRLSLIAMSNEKLHKTFSL